MMKTNLPCAHGASNEASARNACLKALCALGVCAALCAFGGCAGASGVSEATPSGSSANVAASSASPTDSAGSTRASSEAASSAAASTVWVQVSDTSAPSSTGSSPAARAVDRDTVIAQLWDRLDIEQDYRESFVHGDKPAKYQKYIVLHDTEGDGEASGVVDYWDGSGAGVAAHFVVNKDGSIVQCVKLDAIAHHAGFGDTGHNEKYGVEDESRDDKVGTVELGEGVEDYGMNSYSIGIEMVHVGGAGEYPEEQLAALDNLIAYIDAYYGKESQIIDHKAWRTGNSDTSEEFAGYLANYQDHRTHLDKG